MYGPNYSFKYKVVLEMPAIQCQVPGPGHSGDKILALCITAPFLKSTIGSKISVSMSK